MRVRCKGKGERKQEREGEERIRTRENRIDTKCTQNRDRNREGTSETAAATESDRANGTRGGWTESGYM